ncbi:hypothetical protein JCM8115_000924 [Rhodotorula mucilaginosa]
MPDWSDDNDDDDASGTEDMDEAPVRLTQIVSPRTGKTRTIVRKPAAELPPPTTSISTSVGDLQLPSFMLSNQSTKARQQRTYSPPPEWLAAALSGTTNSEQSAPSRPGAFDSFPTSRPAALDSMPTVGPLGSFIDESDNSNSRHARYDAVGSSPTFRHDFFRTAAPEPAQLDHDRSPTRSPLPFSLPGHMPHQHAASSPSDLTSMSRFTPPTSVTPLYEAQMLRAPPHAYAFAAEEGVFSPFSPQRSDPWSAQQLAGHPFMDDSFDGGDDDRHVHNGPSLSSWYDPERARLDDKGQPSTFRAWHPARHPSIDYPRSDNGIVPPALARGQYPALPHQNMQDSMPRHSLPLHSRETPPPNPQQMVQELARARRVAKLEEAAAEVVGPMSPLLFIRNPDRPDVPPLAASLAAAAAEEEDRFSPLPLPPIRSLSSASEEEVSANGAASTYERRHFQTPEPRLPSFFSSFATQPHHNAAAAVPNSRPTSTRSYLPESGVPLTVNLRFEGEDDRAHGDDSFAVHEPADEDSTDVKDSGAGRTAVEPSAKPASPSRTDLPFTIYEDSD